MGPKPFRGPKPVKFGKPAPKSRPRPRTTTQSFSSAPFLSSSTIYLPDLKRKSSAFKIFLLGFCGVFALILLGGGHNAIALGFALFLPGIFLTLAPPQKGLGKRADMAAGAFLVSLLFAFIPQFYWPDADWRTAAQDAFSIDLAASLSVQPWISFEAWLMAVAGFAWFYAALQWRVNSPGRKWLFFWFSIIISAFAGIVIWGNLAGASYPAAENATAFSFFPNRNQTANFLALGGIATFAYAMEALRNRTLIQLVGVPASILCLVGLVLGVSRAGVLLYFLGIFIWFVSSMRSRSVPRLFKIGVPLVVIAMSFAVSSNERTVQRVMAFANPATEIGDEFRIKMYRDASDMILDAPLTGFGLGSFPAVFPQYRDASANHQRVVHPESDFFWLASEGGLVAVILFGFFLLAYLARCRGLSDGPSGKYRIFALIAVAVFFIHAMVDVPGHRPGTVYFAILFAALALPSEKREATLLRPVYWRVIGSALVLIGVIWMVAGVFRAPLHSSVRVEKYQADISALVEVADYPNAKEAADRWLALHPMEWQAYFRRAQLILADSGNRTEAAADFRRARFVEPILGVVSYEEGRAWLYVDTGRAMSAWRETLFREVQSMEYTFGRMLNHVRNSPERMEQLARLSEIDPYYRSYLLCFLRYDEFMAELKLELSKDPTLSRYSVEQRTAIVQNWVKRGDGSSAEEFLESYSDSLDNAWWLWSLLRKEQAAFEDAVQYIRSNIEIPKIPEVDMDEATFARLTREYSLAPKDIFKGTALLYRYVESGEYHLAIPILDAMLESHKPPLYLYYWRAECFYQIEEYIESWFTFETYFKELWGEN